MRIIQLHEAQGVNADDVFVININGVDYQVTAALLAAAMATVGDYLTSDNLPLPVGSGGTGATSAAAARTALAITPVNIGALPSANVYNALDQAGAGYALDARQGKALDEAKQNKLTFDTEPTEDSTNPVTSGGVYNAIQQSTANMARISSGALASGATITINPTGPCFVSMFRGSTTGISTTAIVDSWALPTYLSNNSVFSIAVTAVTGGLNVSMTNTSGSYCNYIVIY